MELFKECCTDRANLRRLMRTLRMKGAFARMGFRSNLSDARSEADLRSKPGQPLIYCTQPDLDRAFLSSDGMCWNTLWITFDIHVPEDMQLSNTEKFDQAVRGVVQLVLSTAEELGITNIKWDGDIGTCIAMRPRSERLKS
jgi:hypothetical protein